MKRESHQLQCLEIWGRTTAADPPRLSIRERLQALKESGVNALNVSMMGQTLEDRVKTCEQLRNIVDTL
jgi:hypothetical protein